MANPPVDKHPDAAVVGVVGLGHMGEAFALNLIGSGYRVLAYDRNADRVERLGRRGAEVASRLAALSACDIVVTSLPDDSALEAVMLSRGGLIGLLSPNALHLSMSTISPGLSRRLDKAHRDAGQHYVAAPVLGNPDLARAGKLFVLAAGADNDLARVRPLLDHLGQRVFVIGQDPSAANLMKLAGNVMTATTLQSMGEVLALLRKGGIAEQTAFDVLTNSLFDSRVHRVYGGKIVERRFRPAGMTVPLAVKDLRLALAEGERESVPMPSASVARDRLVGMIARGWSDLDWSALGLLAAEEAGLDGSVAGPAAARS